MSTAGPPAGPPAERPTGPWLVVGLGNPGEKYAGNRHNLGFHVLDVLAQRLGVRFKAHKTRAELAAGVLRGERVVLAKPRSYVNESGGPVSGVRSFYRIATDALVVVHDELDIDFGRIRLRYDGGDGGHNGLRSLRKSLGTGDYYRVRVGVGRPPGRQDPADFVLKDFSATERPMLPLLLERAAEAVETLISTGLEAAQNAYHPLE